MKNALLVTIIVFLFSFCKSNVENRDNTAKVDSLVLYASPAQDTINKDDNLLANPFQIKNEEFLGDTLIGMVLNEETESKDPYEMYMLDVSNVCYESNLATFEIKENEIILEDYWGAEQKQTFKIIDVVVSNDTIELYGNNVKFIFTKIDSAPVYLLNIVGNLDTDLKINKYFTKKSKLSRFRIHVCGEFEG